MRSEHYVTSTVIYRIIKLKLSLQVLAVSPTNDSTMLTNLEFTSKHSNFCPQTSPIFLHHRKVDVHLDFISTLEQMSSDEIRNSESVSFPLLQSPSSRT